MTEFLVGPHGDVLVHAELGERLGDLEGTHHAAPRDLVHRQAGDVFAQQLDTPAVDRQEAGDRGEQRGLARAVGPDQRHDAALINRQCGVVDGPQAAEDLGQSGNFQHHFATFAKRGLRFLKRSISPLGRKAMMTTSSAPYKTSDRPCTEVSERVPSLSPANSTAPISGP